jgi:hypothetical protein
MHTAIHQKIKVCAANSKSANVHCESQIFQPHPSSIQISDFTPNTNIRLDKMFYYLATKTNREPSYTPLFIGTSPDQNILRLLAQLAQLTTEVLNFVRLRHILFTLTSTLDHDPATM